MSRETWEGVLMQKTLWWFAVLALLVALGPSIAAARAAGYGACVRPSDRAEVPLP